MYEEVEKPEGQICLPTKKQKLTIAKSEGVRRGKEMSQNFSLSAYETSVHDHTI